MPVRLEQLTFSFVDSRPLFDRLEVELGPGFTGVVGPNGAGKSSLLALISGALSPTSGRVRLPPTARVVHVTQDVAHPSDAVSMLADAVDGNAQKLIAALDLDVAAVPRWATLSPGERRRFQLASALYAEPDVLLLDEPDTHLDSDARALVLRALRQFRGIGVLVSHRRDVLDAITKSTLWLEDGRAEQFALPYSGARDARELGRASRVAERAAMKSAVHKLERAFDDRRREHAGAASQISTRKRMKGPHDSDARGLLARGRAENAAKALGRAQAALKSRLDRSQSELDKLVVDRRLGGELSFKAGRGAERIVTLCNDEILAGDKRVLGRTSLVVSRSTRVRLSGANGAGKSTLLRAIAAALPDRRGLFLPQWLDEPARQALRRELDTLSASERGRRLSLLATLGTDPDALLSSTTPSAGEARKLALTKALAGEVGCLLLDEPTNDLDLPSVERLETALAAYEGALVLVTHDDQLARATTSAEWRIEAGRLQLE